MAKTFVNPILNGDYPDPTIVRRGDDYYLTYSCTNNMPGLKMMHSRDLVHWKTLCGAVPNTGCIAAPELIVHNGLFYLYYPANHTNYVVTAKDPAGPWSDPIDLHIGQIDPGHVVGPDGTRYLYLSGGHAVRLSVDGLRVEEDLGVLYNGWDFPADYHTEGKFLESPKFFQRNGYYYIVSAQGGTAGPSTAHMCVVARSQSPLGPWENMPSNPLVHTWSREEKWWCKGHGTIFQAADGAWYIVYHAYEKGCLNHGRKTLLEPVEWTDDGWPYIPKSHAEAPLSISAGEESPADIFCDDFANGQIKPYWSFWCHYAPERLSAAPKGGLRLTGKGNTPGTSSPMTFPCGEKSYTLEVDVSLEGAAQGGLVLFYDESHYCGIGLGARGIQLYKYGEAYLSIPAVSRQMTLRIINDYNEIRYAYKLFDEGWKWIDFGCEVSGINHNALNGYNSLRPGLFALGDGAVCFQNFRLVPEQ
ncbi:MAG: family 43 glycosylhydrolase [Clostridia bacterium]|nr:family 43 glycosylhydrolase [Clostridia bacterium]